MAVQSDVSVLRDERLISDALAPTRWRIPTWLRVITILAVALAAVWRLDDTFDGLPAGWPMPARALSIVAIVGVGLLDIPQRRVDVTWGDRHVAVGGVGLVLLGLGLVVTVGQAHPVVAMAGWLAHVIGTGLTILALLRSSALVPLVLPVGVVGTSLLAVAIGASAGLTRDRWLAAAAAMPVLCAAATWRRGGIATTTSVQPGRVIVVASAAIAICGLGIGVTTLGYRELQPSVPFGRDLQHPTNINHILTTGKAQARNENLSEFYPDTFGYWAAGPALAARMDALQLLSVLGPVLWLMSAGMVFWLALSFFGPTIGLIALGLYSLGSFQPRATLFDLSVIGMVGEYILLPGAVFTVWKCLERPDTRRLAWLGILIVGLIQMHLLATSRFLVIVVPVILMDLLQASDRRRRAASYLLVLVGVAVGGFPYSWRFVRIYVDGLATALHIAIPVARVDYPTISFPADFASYLGRPYFVLLLFAFIALVLSRPSPRTDRHLWSLLSWWVVATGMLVITKLLVAPERDLRSLVIVGSIVIAWFVGVMIARFAGELRGLLFALVAAAALLYLTPSVVTKTRLISRLATYASPAEISFMSGLHVNQLKGRIGTDESGVWLPYYAADFNQVVVSAGPASLSWFGEPERSDMRAVYAAIDGRCSASAHADLGDIGVRYIYLGPRPQHWVPPGFEYHPASKLLACPTLYSPVAHDPDINAYLYEVR